VTRSVRFWSLVLLVCGLSAAHAQEEPIERRLRTSRGHRLPVAIEDLTLGGGSTTPEQLRIISELGEVIRQDLAFSGYFKIIRFDSLYLKLMGVTALDQQGWAHLGAEYLGTGRVTPTGDGFKLTLKLTGTMSNEEIFEKSFTGTWDRWRQSAHQVAGELIYYLWGGRTRVFETRIVASWRSSEEKNLYMFDFDGHNARALTNHGEINISPCWFPSGDRLVFTSYREDNPDLWLLLLGNNSVQKISGREGLNTAPAVSPDGHLLAVTLSVDGNAEIYLLTESGQNPRRLTHSRGIDTEPAFSPDGRFIAFTSDRMGSPQVYVMHVDGSNARRLTYRGNYNASPSWSPGGDWIAFASRHERGQFDVCKVRTDGTGFVRLTRKGSNKDPSWSPDGYHLVYSSLRNGQRNLYTITYDGSGERQITTGGGFTNPAWGPFPRR